MKLKNYLLIIVFYSLFFLVGDLIFSNFIYKKDVNIKYNCFEYKNYLLKEDSYHDYYLQKNCIATERQRTVLPYKVFTDQDGYRFSGKKRSLKENNLVFLGDSHTYAMGVNFEDSFSGIVEEDIKNYGVYNLGVPGYGIQKHYYNLNEFFKKKNASKIILTLDMTDIYDAANRWRFIANTKSPVLKSKHTNKKISDWKAMQNSNFKGSKIIVFQVRNSLRYIKLKIRSINKKYKNVVLKTEIANYTYVDLDKRSPLNYLSKDDFKRGVSIINLYLKKIANLAENNQAELYIMIFPWPETLIYGQEKFSWEKFNSNLCKKNKCSNVINLFDDFKKIKSENKNWKNLIYIDEDIHFNKFGNNLVANKIIREINN
jgi:hypothetical protein|tara:strand:+ start:996 stop:2111 length:1116 start_codon:yes stop_codon:yes gene_type:complete